MKLILLLLALLVAPLAAQATNCSGYTYTLTNGQLADANQVMSNFNSILNCANNNLAESGANYSILSLNGMTTPLPISEGGTGNTSGAASSIAGIAAGGVLTGTYPNPTLGLFGANTILANATGSEAAPLAVNGTTLMTILPAFTGDSGSGGVSGVVPAPPSGSASAGKVLGAGGSWVAGAVSYPPFAYANVTCSPSSCTINGTALNVASVTYNSTGNYTVVFTTGATDAYYVAFANPINTATVSQVVTQTTAHAIVKTYAVNTTLVLTDTQFSILIFGN